MNSCKNCKFLAKTFTYKGKEDSKRFYCAFMLDISKIPAAFICDNPEMTKQDFQENCPTWEKKK